MTTGQPNKMMEGIRVIEVAQWWFVPAATAILGDWGAEVIKIEHPISGDPQRALMTGGLMPAVSGVNFMSEQPNRNKRSVGLDLATPGGLELLGKFVKDADVFVTSFLPDARKKLGIDLEDIRKINPNIIYVRGSGQGVRGPDAAKGGYDAASFWSRGGVGYALTPVDAPAPVFQRAAFGDSIGAMTLAGGISAALFNRERTGRPPVVDVSLLGTAMWVMAPDIIASKVIPGGIPSFGGRATPNPLVNIYKTKDERWIMLLLLQPDRYWPDFCAHINRPELLEDERFGDGMSRFMNSAALVAILDEVFGARTLDEWRITLDTMEGPWAPMQKPEELHDDPQAVANGYLPTVTIDEEEVRLVASPVQFDEQPIECVRSPELGENTEEVLLELGISWEQIAEYKELGAIS